MGLIQKIGATARERSDLGEALSCDISALAGDIIKAALHNGPIFVSHYTDEALF